jgi:hypothetical protein
MGGDVEEFDEVWDTLDNCLEKYIAEVQESRTT